MFSQLPKNLTLDYLSQEATMKSLLFISIFFLQACSNLPANIKNAPSADVQLQQVLANSSNFQNNPVRWGGTIIEVVNEPDETKMQILLYPLNYYGRPVLSRTAMGRFIAVSKLFLDPAIYPKGTEITIAGSLQGTIKKKVGEKAVIIPVVAIDEYHVWPAYQRSYYYNDSYYGYPNYYSGYRYGRYYPTFYFNGRYRNYGCY